MNTAVSNTETSVSEEADLINQIVVALASKAAPSILSTTTKPSSNSTSISFSGLSDEPKMFAICPTGNITLGTTRYVTGVVYDGITTQGTYGYRLGSSATSYYSASYFTWTYSNGTLTVKTSSGTNGGNFASSATYKLVYIAAASNDTSQIILQSKTVTPTKSLQTISPDSGYNGLSQVTVNAIPSTYLQKQQKTGTFTTTSDGYATLNIGFKPDVITIILGDPWYDSDHQFYVDESFSASFIDSSNARSGLVWSTYGDSIGYPYLFCGVYLASQTTVGVQLNAINYSLEWYPVPNETFSYVATKYS